MSTQIRIIIDDVDADNVTRRHLCSATIKTATEIDITQCRVIIDAIRELLGKWFPAHSMVRHER